jgi:hypothetical protein
MTYMDDQFMFLHPVVDREIMIGYVSFFINILNRFHDSSYKYAPPLKDFACTSFFPECRVEVLAQKVISTHHTWFALPF